jgi:predicted nucleotidyltransferase
MEEPRKAFSSRDLEALAKTFLKHGVDYLIIGKAGAVVYGFPDTTQDIDLFPEKSAQNGRRIVQAMNELGFQIDQKLEQAIVQGKDFIQIRGGPFDIDFVFAPDGIDSYREAKERASLIEDRYPVASIDDIIQSKRKAGRQRDREVLGRLESFAKYLKEKKKS